MPCSTMPPSPSKSSQSAETGFWKPGAAAPQPPIRSMQQQSSGRGRGHWDQEEIRRRALSPSDFPGGKENPIPQREELLEGESLMSPPASPMARDLSQRNQSQRPRDGTSLGALRAEVENRAAIKGEYQLCRRVGHSKVEAGVAPANLANQAGAASASPACLSLAQEPHLPQGPSGPFIFTAVTTAPRGHIGYRDP